MTIWNKQASIEELNNWAQDTLISHINIKFSKLGPDFLTAIMPVSEKTRQPMGILHGGASCVLSETVGTAAAHLAADSNKTCVGLELNINHIKKVSQGEIEAIASPLHIGRSTQVWEIKIFNSQKELIAAARLTVAVVEIKNVSKQKTP